MSDIELRNAIGKLLAQPGADGKVWLWPSEAYALVRAFLVALLEPKA